MDIVRVPGGGRVLVSDPVEAWVLVLGVLCLRLCAGVHCFGIDLLGTVTGIEVRSGPAFVVCMCACVSVCVYIICVHLAHGLDVSWV